jgi:hypothetical protein
MYIDFNYKIIHNIINSFWYIKRLYYKGYILNNMLKILIFAHFLKVVTLIMLI